jgi:hypothetical protein
MCDPLDDLITTMFSRATQLGTLAVAPPQHVSVAPPQPAPNTARTSSQEKKNGAGSDSRNEMLFAALVLAAGAGLVLWRIITARHRYHRRERQQGGHHVQVSLSALIGAPKATCMSTAVHSAEETGFCSAVRRSCHAKSTLTCYHSYRVKLICYYTYRK